MTSRRRSSGPCACSLPSRSATFVFQAAQSLQVPAYEPLLVGVWGLGALLWAYAVRGVASLVLAVGLLAFWSVWEVLSAGDGAFAVSTATAAAALAMVSVGDLTW